MSVQALGPGLATPRTLRGASCNDCVRLLPCLLLTQIIAVVEVKEETLTISGRRTEESQCAVNMSVARIADVTWRYLSCGHTWEWLLRLSLLTAYRVRKIKLLC